MSAKDDDNSASAAGGPLRPAALAASPCHPRPDAAAPAAVSFAHLPPPPLPHNDMARDSPPTSSPVLQRRGATGASIAAAGVGLPGMPLDKEHAFHQQIQQLKKQQQLQQQILLQHFQAQRQQLAEQHEQQLRHHIKLWEQQKQLEEQRERREKEKLEAIKKKDKHEQSAVASTEVKQKLQNFLLNKKQCEAAAAANGATSASGMSSLSGSASNFRNWSILHGHDGGPGTAAAGSSAGAHPYRLPSIVAKYDDDFPLRKTAEVNAGGVGANSVDSGPNSPPAIPGGGGRQPSPSHQMGRSSTPIQEEGEGCGSQQGSVGELSLYSSPSMPNISLGRPPTHSVPDATHLHGSAGLGTVSEAEVRAAFTARLGMPLTGQMLPGTLPFYPTLPVIDGEYSYAGGSATLGTAPGITDAQVAHARLNRRPLGRTQSAPLPLGHPVLALVPPSHSPSQYDDFQHQQQQQQHNFLRQQIRQTVLTRAGSRSQAAAAAAAAAGGGGPGGITAGQLDEAPEVEADDSAEIIDLTDRRSDESEMSRQQRDRERFLQQQRDLMMRHTAQGSDGSFLGRPSVSGRPLARALSSPLVAVGASEGAGPTSGTALAFDSAMLKHACVCGDNSGHPEHGGRLQSVWARLLETGLVARCQRPRARKASLEEIRACHSEAHALLFGTSPLNRQKLDVGKLSQLPVKSFVRLPCGGVGVDSDTTWNDVHTATAARTAVGCVVDLAFKAATGDIKNGFAIVRPPGHHAEASQAMGFCFFNSVAIAARLLQQRLNLHRILVVDWDVHHGNGTQQMFYDDPRILYLSIHRHDDGNFFPGTGGPTECGMAEGLGFNVNVAWSGGLAPPMGDAEYLAAFRTVVMPIAKEYSPEVVLVSAGFDAAAGHAAPLGGYKVSPACFGHMTHQLMQLADGKVILSLEGGYDLASICDSAEECVRALLGDEPSPLSEDELQRSPCQNAVDTLQKTIAIQLSHWPCLKRAAHTVSWSAMEAAQKEAEESETLSAMASLSMRHQSNSLQSPPHSREPSEEPMEQDDAK
ncbi:histone deacetylase 5 isoform X2 [Schistocerca gregaria]|uniref:histone deacetylase 5 isoform X2 n=1 Tax=Schistocerca gregaria TaxID=7010 RepID=UPI00211DBD41|nr:histone deacetylase 5 isoform X2 [Schistocerca gregaria]XP_049860822.1 histone deacetylase 5 isoform X2 [Schistocerca gregaria]